MTTTPGCDADDLWVAVLRAVAGNTVIRNAAEAAEIGDPTSWHVVVCRESAIAKVQMVNWVSESFDGLPDSDDVAAWFDGHLIRDTDHLWRRLYQANGMAYGLNTWEEAAEKFRRDATT